MKHHPLVVATATLVLAVCTAAADSTAAAHSEPDAWTAFNRTATHRPEGVHLDAKQGDGVLWLDGVLFGDGTLEFDVKGRDAPGRSFVGIAFHGADDRTYEAVYFRPFNFRNPARRLHAVQYVSLPDHDWAALRSAFPGRYEAAIDPAPEPEAWLHVRVEVKHPSVTVYVNHASTPALQIGQLSHLGQGRVGFWVGNGSEGWFRNLRIEQAE